MRQGCEYKKLGEVASSELGKTLNRSKDTGKLYPYICAVNVLWDMIDFTILKHAFFEKEEIDRYSVRKGDLLVCEGGDTGRSAIWEKEEPVLYQNALHRVRFTTEMEARFAMYCLWHLKNNGQIDQKYSKGVTIKHLVKSSLLSIELPVPPLSTQLSIVSELDKINELIHLKKEQLKDYDNLAQSIFYEMFGDPVVNEKGWEVKRITDLCIEISAGGDASKHEIKKTKDEIFSVPVYSNGIDEDGLYGYSNHATINQPAITLAARGTIGAAFIRTEPYIPIIRLVSVIPDLSKISLTYLFYILKQTEWDRTGGTIPQLPVPKVKQLTLPLPPLPLQQAFAQRIKLIEQQKAEIQNTIADLETLLASRMQYWFD